MVAQTSTTSRSQPSTQFIDNCCAKACPCKRLPSSADEINMLADCAEIFKRKTIFHFRPIEVEEIRDAFATVKTAKSFGTDNISSYFLKLALPFIENLLAFLFNTSIETSHFPYSWKVVRVTPIFKDGDRTEKSNYRPISGLPVISRLFEKLMADQLYQYMNDNDHFYLANPALCAFIQQ